MNFLAVSAVKRPVATIMAYLACGMFGIVALSRLPVDLMPSSESGTITIFIGVRGGMPPEDIEYLVTKPVEEAVSTVSDLKEITSSSRKDRAMITLTFMPHADLRFAALEVQERLSKIRGKLPKEIEKPVVAHYEESDYPILILALTSDKRTPEDLRRLVDENLKPAITRVDGVANVEVWGGRERKILVEFDHTKLAAYNLPITHVIYHLGANNLNLLAGQIDRSRDSYFVRSMGAYKTVGDIEILSVSQSPEGSRIRIRDIAKVRDFFLEAESYSRYNQQPSVSLYIQKESLANTVRVAENVKATLEEFKKNLEKDITINVVSDQAVFIRDAIKTVKSAIFHGAILTAFILWIFLKDFKHTTVIFISIPLCIMITFGFMYLTKTSINVMTLSGLAIALGMIVDDSIVVLVNILERKRANTGIEDQATLKQTTIDATNEMALPATASTITTVIVFFPLVFISQEVKAMYTGLALTIFFAISSSLIVALSIIPLLSSRLKANVETGETEQHFTAIKNKLAPVLTKIAGVVNALRYGFATHVPAPRLHTKIFGMRPRRIHDFVNIFLTRPLRAYRVVISQIIRRRYWALCFVVALGLGSAAVYKFCLEKEYLGHAEQDEFIIFVELPSGAKLDVSNQVVADVEKAVNDIPEIKKVVKSVVARVEGWSSKIYVTLVPRSERARTVQEIIRTLRPHLNKIGAVYDSFIYFSEPEHSKELVIDVFGQDYTTLKDTAVSIGQEIKSVKGLTDTKLRYKPGRPEIRASVNHQRATFLGFTTREIADNLHAELRGLRATYFNTPSNQIETIARLREEDRKTVEDIYNLTFVSEGGLLTPVEQLINFDYGLTPSEIWHKGKERMIQVSANREKIALSTTVDLVRKQMDVVKFPTGYYYEFGGDYAEMMRNEKEFALAFVLMIALVYIVLACLFESYIQPALVLLAVPLALCSVMPTLYFLHIPVSMGVYIGLIMLGGIVVRNSIILVDRLNVLKLQTNLLHAIFVTGQERMKPIIMTSLTTVFGLVPMVFSKSESSDLWSPLAITVISGMVGSTFLTLCVVPGLYAIIEDIKNMLNKRHVSVASTSFPHSPTPSVPSPVLGDGSAG